MVALDALVYTIFLEMVLRGLLCIILSVIKIWLSNPKASFVEGTNLPILLTNYKWSGSEMGEGGGKIYICALPCADSEPYLYLGEIFNLKDQNIGYISENM